MTSRVRHELEGLIASSGFASGDRVVIGHWRRSPLGTMSDVMWARPDGERVLLAPDDEVAAFITAVYEFDRVEVVPFDVAGGDGGDGAGIDVTAGDLRVQLEGGRAQPVPLRRRPAWVTRWIERPIARAAMGVTTFGITPSGVHEWYRADRYQVVVDGHASLDGHDLGPIAPVDPPCRFGFSEPPRRPSIVSVRPMLHDPSGRLDILLQNLEKGAARGPR